MRHGTALDLALGTCRHANWAWVFFARAACTLMELFILYIERVEAFKVDQGLRIMMESDDDSNSAPIIFYGEEDSLDEEDSSDDEMMG